MLNLTKIKNTLEERNFRQKKTQNTLEERPPEKSCSTSILQRNPIETHDIFKIERRSLACELTAHLIRAWLAFEPLWRNIFYRDFQLQGILFKKWSWAWFFRRPLYQCDFEICSTTPQLDPNRKPIWFCNCKLRYTVWEIWESQLVHIRTWAILKQLFDSFLPSSRGHLLSKGSRSLLFWQ